MPMNVRLLRPRQTIHPEAADWRSRVIANGGSVSGTTLNAVDRFVKAIHAAGIRDRFYRLNLFAGSNLSAALVPLFRNTSLSGSPLGNATDTNNGPFVSGDYSESVGLSRLTAENKRLDTGLATSALPAGVISSGHVSVWHGPLVATGDSDPILIGAFNGSIDRVSIAQSFRSASAAPENARFGKATSVTATDGTTGFSKPSTFLLAQRTSATNLELWRNNSLAATNTTSTTGIAGITHPIIVFGYNNSGTPAGELNELNLRHYSIGDDMTSAQVAAFYAALQTFNTSLGRTA